MTSLQWLFFKVKPGIPVNKESLIQNLPSSRYISKFDWVVLDFVATRIKSKEDYFAKSLLHLLQNPWWLRITEILNRVQNCENSDEYAHGKFEVNNDALSDLRIEKISSQGSLVLLASKSSNHLLTDAGLWISSPVQDDLRHSPLSFRPEFTLICSQTSESMQLLVHELSIAARMRCSKRQTRSTVV